jgi:hypothetical protein
MFKKCISWAVTIMGTAAVALLPACSSSSTGNHDASPSDRDSSPNNPEGGGLRACVPTEYCTNPPTCKPSAFCLNPGGAGSITLCSGEVTEATIDDMTASTITFTPPSCATKGEWDTFVNGTGTITPPATGAFVYSALPDPAGLPVGVLAAADAGGATGTGPMAACVTGSTDAIQYDEADLGVQLGNSTPPDGGLSSPPLIDASAYTGVQFWLWASPSTAAALSANLQVQLADKNETEIFGICNVNAPLGVPMQLGCGRATATVSGNAASVAFNDPGVLHGADGGNATIVAGWQLIQVPFVNFVTNTYYGGGNESVADPTKIAAIGFSIQNVAAAAVAFDYCIYDLAFYH